MIKSSAFLCVDDDALEKLHEDYGKKVGLYGSAFSPDSAHMQLIIDGCQVSDCIAERLDYFSKNMLTLF